MVVQVKICRRQASIAVTVGGAAAVRAVPAGCLQLVTTRQGRQGGTQPWILQSGDLVSIVSARISWPVDAYERSRLALCVALLCVCVCACVCVCVCVCVLTPKTSLSGA